MNAAIIVRVEGMPEVVDVDSILRLCGGFSDEITGMARRYNYDRGVRDLEVYLEVASLRLSRIQMHMYGITIRFCITNLVWRRVEIVEGQRPIVPPTPAILVSGLPRCDPNLDILTYHLRRLLSLMPIDDIASICLDHNRQGTGYVSFESSTIFDQFMHGQAETFVWIDGRNLRFSSEFSYNALLNLRDFDEIDSTQTYTVGHHRKSLVIIKLGNLVQQQHPVKH
jgi:hypothetical protein